LKQKKIIGVWDFDSSDSRLGSLFIFIHELECNYSESAAILLKHFHSKHEPFLSVLKRFSSHDIVMSADQPETIYDQLIHDSIDASKTSRQGSMRLIADLYSKAERRSPNPNIKLLHQTKQFKFAISVHLKNNKLDVQSNADQTAWYCVFNLLCEIAPQIRFLLVGDDNVSQDIMDLDNVFIYSGQLADYYSVVCESDGFIGMSSAFCAAAILGHKPYRIWKHIGHHSTEMELELDSQKQFPFRCNNQKLLIATDSKDSVKQECIEMLLAIGIEINV
jgi:hypothetical protein